MPIPTKLITAFECTTNFLCRRFEKTAE